MTTRPTIARVDSFTPAEHPAIAATISAFSTARDGCNVIWAHEMEHQTGRAFVVFCFEVFKAIVLPLLALLWLAMTTAYRWARSAETRRWIKNRVESVRSRFVAEPIEQKKLDVG